MFGFLDATQATATAVALADGLVGSTSQARSRSRGGKPVLQHFVEQVDQHTRDLKLNFLQRARLANTFKWRLREKGVDSEVTEELTRALVLRLAGQSAAGSPSATPPDAAKAAARSGLGPQDVAALLARADGFLKEGAVSEAVTTYQELLHTDSRHAVAHNNLGGALSRLGRYPEAAEHFRTATLLKPSYLDAHANLGTVLRWLGQYDEAEIPLRKVLKARPKSVEAQVALGSALVQRGGTQEARELLHRATAVKPVSVDALVTLAQLDALEGRMEEAEAAYRGATARDPLSCLAWAGLVRVRRMTPQDTRWLAGAKRAAAEATSMMDRILIQFAIGKYHDDVGAFDAAFRSFTQANELQRPLAVPYDRAAHARAVGATLRLWTRERLATVAAGASDSVRPVFVVGMPRSGTSLVEQIIASHPKAAGAGELDFWANAKSRHPELESGEVPSESLRRELAEQYLRVLSAASANAERVVDKAIVNPLHLGLIRNVFPRARIIHVRRDPLDTCLSAFMQPFPPSLNFAMDLGDLAYYYGQRQRLMAHWRSVMPPDAMLEVRYEDLVADQEEWTRRMMAFLGLPWNDQTLEFHTTSRLVLTASYWQVRQRMYHSSVGRWQHYRKHLGPLLKLR